MTIFLLLGMLAFTVLSTNRIHSINEKRQSGESAASLETQNDRDSEASAFDPADIEVSPEPNMDHLRALGYVEWDEDADASVRGVTQLDVSRVAPGYGLYTNDRSTAFLVDLHGEVVHQWNAPPNSKRCEFAQLLSNDLLALVCLNRSVLFLDWDSRLVAKAEIPAHHEAAPVGEGAVLVPIHEQYEYQGRTVTFDAIVRVEPGQAPERIWSTWDARVELRKLHASLPLDEPELPKNLAGWMLLEGGFDYYHMNSIQELPDTALGQEDARFRAGNYLVSLRNTSLLVIVDADSREIVWSWGPGDVELQHHPRMLPNGNILVFDNGTFRRWSRVIEVNPKDGQIVWEYRSEDFFSAWRGSAQRLANGNTMICDAESGRAFEVTIEGEIVWEFWNPLFSRDGMRRRIYRFLKVPADRAERLAAKRGETLVAIRPRVVDSAR